MKRVIAVVLAAVCLFQLPCVADNETGEAPKAATAKSALLMEETTGEILYAQDENQPVAPASITKIMGLILVAQELERGAMSLEEKLTCSEYAKTMGGSEIWLKVGEQMTVEDLLKAVVIASANDAMVVFAEKIGGTEEGFAEMMNQKARELGANNTTFVNCTGFDEEGHLTTAYDIAIMARELMRHPIITQYSTIWMDSLRGGETQLVNTNRLVRFYDGTTGLKTGTTEAAGHCLCATAKRGDLSLISVVMGCKTGEDRFEESKQLLDYGFSTYTIYQPQPVEMEPLAVGRGTQEQVPLRCPAPQGIVMTKEQAQLAQEIVPQLDRVEAPVEEGQKVGEVQVTVDGKTVATYPIEAAYAVPRRTVGKSIGMLFMALIGMM